METLQSISGELLKFGKDGIYKKTKVVVKLYTKKSDL